MLFPSQQFLLTYILNPHFLSVLQLIPILTFFQLLIVILYFSIGTSFFYFCPEILYCRIVSTLYFFTVIFISTINPRKAKVAFVRLVAESISVKVGITRFKDQNCNQ